MKAVDIQPELDCLRQSASLVKAAIAALTRVPHFSKQYESRSLRFVEGVEQLCATNLPQLDRPLEVALCGAFSSGKSSLINAFLGNSYCPTHRDVTTKQCTCFLYGEKESFIDATGHCWKFEDYQQRVKAEDGCVFSVTLPNELLKRIHIWDVPGLNAPGDNGNVDELKSKQVCDKADCIMYLTENPAEEPDFQALAEMHGKDVIVVLPKCDDNSDDPEQQYKKLCNDLKNREEEFKKQDTKIVKILFCGGFNPKDPCDKMKEASIKKIKKALLELHVAAQKRKEHETQRLLADIGKRAKTSQKDILWFNERMVEWRRLLADEKSRFDEVAKLLTPEAVVDTAHDNLEETCRDLLRDVQNSDNALTVSGNRFRKKKVSVNIELVASLLNSNSYIVGVLCRELHVDELPAGNMEAGELVRRCCDSILDILEPSFRQYEEEARSLSLEASYWTTKLMEAGKKELKKWYKSKSYKLGKRLREDDIVNHLKSLADDLSNMVETQSASRCRNLAQLDFFENTLAGAGMLLEELQDLKGA